MRVAITFDDGEIFQHFGHTQQFKLYDVEDGQISGTRIADTNGSGHGALAGFLKENGVDKLICGGIGGGAQEALSQAGIELYAGVSGRADEAIVKFLTGALSYGTEANCDHHEHEEGKSCGDHGCGGACQGE